MDRNPPRVSPPVLLLDYPAAAQALSMTRGALRDLVYKGRGPAVTRIGTRTFFAVRDLEAFVERHRESGAGR
jgi:Helix-turn-helix domain